MSELERRGHKIVSRGLSDGPDIRPDTNLSGRIQMYNEYVKEEEYQKWVKANEAGLRARTRQSFIVGAIFGILVLVAIIMAGVSLGKTAKNTSKLDDHEVKKVNLGDLEEELKLKLPALCSTKYLTIS